MLVGKVGYFKGTYGQAGYIWVTVMVWERAGTMLIILSVADNCTVPTNKIEPNQWLSSLIFSTLPYT